MAGLSPKISTREPFKAAAQRRSGSIQPAVAVAKDDSRYHRCLSARVQGTTPDA